jgi:hypothetical protein
MLKARYKGNRWCAVPPAECFSATVVNVAVYRDKLLQLQPLTFDQHNEQCLTCMTQVDRYRLCVCHLNREPTNSCLRLNCVT